MQSNTATFAQYLAEPPDDHCKTPWDYCCETPEDIAAHAATIQLTDDSGPTPPPRRSTPRGGFVVHFVDSHGQVLEAASHPEAGHLPP